MIQAILQIKWQSFLKDILRQTGHYNRQIMSLKDIIKQMEKYSV